MFVYIFPTSDAGTVTIRHELENCPSLFCLCIGWENSEASRESVENLCSKIPESIDLAKLFVESTPPNELDLYLRIFKTF